MSVETRRTNLDEDLAEENFEGRNSRSLVLERMDCLALEIRFLSTVADKEEDSFGFFKYRKCGFCMDAGGYDDLQPQWQDYLGQCRKRVAELRKSDVYARYQRLAGVWSNVSDTRDLNECLGCKSAELDIAERIQELGRFLLENGVDLDEFVTLRFKGLKSVEAFEVKDARLVFKPISGHTYACVDISAIFELAVDCME